MKPLIIEIHGTGTHNRGAELMAITIADRIRQSFPDATLVVPFSFGSQEDRRRYGFATTWERGGRLAFLKSAVARLRSLADFDVINPAKTSIVLDASGFAFSDQWGSAQAKRLAVKMNRRYRRKQRLVLLPQALGSFKDPEVVAWSMKVFDRASLVCARDTQSYEHAKALVAPEKLRLSPDFTVATKPISAQEIPLPESFAAIVPNMRMLDKTDRPGDYLGFLRNAVDAITASGITPSFVVHDAKEDRGVIDRLGDGYTSLPTFTHSDPRVLKWMLGNARFVIGSRFHALVSSLSQGVPCIGVGWSHKYAELFRDFCCEDLHVSNMADATASTRALAAMLDPAERLAHSSRILQASRELKQRTEEMWSEVINIIAEGHPAPQVMRTLP